MYEGLCDLNYVGTMIEYDCHQPMNMWNRDSAFLVNQLSPNKKWEGKCTFHSIVSLRDLDFIKIHCMDPESSFIHHWFLL